MQPLGAVAFDGVDLGVRRLCAAAGAKVLGERQNSSDRNLVVSKGLISEFVHDGETGVKLLSPRSSTGGGSVGGRSMGGGQNNMPSPTPIAHRLRSRRGSAR